MNSKKFYEKSFSLTIPPRNKSVRLPNNVLRKINCKKSESAIYTKKDFLLAKKILN